MQEKNNEKHGIFPIRKCREEEQKVLKDRLQPLKPYYEKNKN